MTRGMIFKGAVLAALIATPALADGKQATIDSIHIVIAHTECGLALPSWSSQPAGESIRFTGLDKEQWANSVGDMATITAAEMYANKSIGRFCVRMAQIYAGAK